MNRNEKQLFSYIHNTLTYLLTGVGLITLGIILFLAFLGGILISDVIIIKVGALFLPFIIIFIGFLLIKEEPKTRKNVKDILKTEIGKEMVLDFPNAKEYFADNFRLGQKFLFVKDKVASLFISQIKIVRISQDQNFSHSLSVLMEDGTLIELKKFNQSEFNKNKEKVDAFVKEITVLNSEILVQV